MQLSLFNNDNLSYLFDVIECDKNFNYLLIDGKYIKNEKRINFTKLEVMKLIESSKRYQRLNYGYEIFYKSNNRYYRLFVRFGNLTTAKNETIYEFVNLGFVMLEDIESGVRDFFERGNYDRN